MFGVSNFGFWWFGVAGVKAISLQGPQRNHAIEKSPHEFRSATESPVFTGAA